MINHFNSTPVCIVKPDCRQHLKQQFCREGKHNGLVNSNQIKDINYIGITLNNQLSQLFMQTTIATNLYIYIYKYPRSVPSLSFLSHIILGHSSSREHNSPHISWTLSIKKYNSSFNYINISWTLSIKKYNSSFNYIYISWTLSINKYNSPFNYIYFLDTQHQEV